jgi:hydroxypyruvate reductase
MWLPVFSQHEALKNAPWGGAVARILTAALEAVEPGEAVRRQVQRGGEALSIGGRVYDLRRFRRVWIVGAGKAGAPMARSMAAILGDRLAGGLVIVKEGHAGRLDGSLQLPNSFGHSASLDVGGLSDNRRPPALAQPDGSLRSHSASLEGEEQDGYLRLHAASLDVGGGLRLVEAGHPIPDERGARGAAQIADLLARLGEDDLVICMISGGGSALLVSPAPGVELAELQALTEALLASGASIDEINSLRKHLEQLKGGGLARLAAPATLATLILSDVVGDPLDVIASGPTVPDPSGYADAWKVVERYQMQNRLPEGVADRLRRGLTGELPETPKPGDPLFERVHNVIIGNNLGAAQAALRQAEVEGFHTLLLTTRLQGEARQAGRFLAAILQQIAASGLPVPRPACLLAGGETTVSVKGNGLGGRNQELALGAVEDLAGLEQVALATLATDGGDGPTDAAGAIATGGTLARARQLGLDPADCLARNDAYHFFDPLGDLIRTGPTQTNVTDLAFLFAF